MYPQYSNLLAADSGANMAEVHTLGEMFGVLQGESSSTQLTESLKRLLGESLASLTGTLTINLTTLSISLHIVG